MPKDTTGIRRLQKEYLMIIKEPVPYVKAHPLPNNIFEWHYIVRGPEGTPYDGGIYHGKLQFPFEYPFKPPSIFMLTPNGRFECNVRLCLSISDYHPETWSPMWSVSTILTGLLSFMVETNWTFGSIITTEYEKKLLAHQSWEFNINDKVFCELFPDDVKEIKEMIRKRQSSDTLSNVSD